MKETDFKRQSGRICNSILFGAFEILTLAF